MNYSRTFTDAILRYGEYLTDEQYTTWDNHNYRLRAIRYNGKLYWHKMVDGELIEFKILRWAKIWLIFFWKNYWQITSSVVL